MQLGNQNRHLRPAWSTTGFHPTQNENCCIICIIDIWCRLYVYLTSLSLSLSLWLSLSLLIRLYTSCLLLYVLTVYIYIYKYQAFLHLSQFHVFTQKQSGTKSWSEVAVGPFTSEGSRPWSAFGWRDLWLCCTPKRPERPRPCPRRWCASGLSTFSPWKKPNEGWNLWGVVVWRLMRRCFIKLWPRLHVQVTWRKLKWLSFLVTHFRIAIGRIMETIVHVLAVCFDKEKSVTTCKVSKSTSSFKLKRISPRSC